MTREEHYKGLIAAGVPAAQAEEVAAKLAAGEPPEWADIILLKEAGVASFTYKEGGHVDVLLYYPTGRWVFIFDVY